MESKRYNLLVENLPDGFALHRVILNDEHEPVDYEFLEVNRAFEELTGLAREEVLGRKVTEVLPGIELSGFDWIAVYGEVALTGESTKFEAYSDPLGRWYEVTAFSPEEEHFVTVFKDNTDQKKESEKSKKVMEYVRKCQELDLKDLDYRFFTDTVREISGAEFVVLNLISEENPGKTVVKAVSGPSDALFRIEGLLGRATEGFSWETDHEKLQVAGRNHLVYYPSFAEIGYYHYPEVSRMLEDLEESFTSGGLYAMELSFRGEPLGVMTLVMPEGQDLDNKETLEFYINQVAATIKRLRAETSLQRKNEEQELLLDNTDYQIWFLLDRCTYGRANRAHAEFLGMEKEHLSERDLFAFLPVEEAERCVDGNVEVFEQKQQIQTEEWATNWKNEYRLLSIKKTPKLDESGRVEYVICSAENITERRQAEKALQESEKRYRGLIESQNDLIVRVNTQNKFIFVNDTFCRTFGKSREELIGNSFTSLVYKDDISNIFLAMEEMKKPPYRAQLELRTFTVNGWRWIHWEDSAILNEEGEIVEIQGVGRDITELKEAEKQITEEAVRKAEGKYREILDSLEEAYFEVNFSGKITFCNQYAALLLGYNQEELLEKNFERFYRDPETLMNILKKIYRSGQAERFSPLEMINKDGRIIYADLTLTAQKDENNTVTGLRISGRDITARIQAEEREHRRNLILTSLARGEPLTYVLDLIVRAIEAEDPEAFGSILLLDKDGQHLLHGSAPSLPEFYNRAIHGLKIGSGVGSCGTAAYTGQRVVVEDILEHPYWEDFLEIARKVNLRSCLSEPVFSVDGKVLAIFTIYYQTSRVPGAVDIERVKTAADLASLAIEHKQAVENLRKSLEQMGSFFEQVNIGLNIIDENMRYLEVNELAAQYIGLPVEEIKGKRIYEVVPHFAAEIENSFKKVLETGRAERNIEVSGTFEGKTVHWLSFHVPITLPDGRPGIGVAAVDITDHKRAEEELQESEAFLRMLTDNMLDMVSKIDLDGTLQYVTPSHKDILGYTQEDLLGKNSFDILHNFVHPEEVNEVTSKFQEVFFQGATGKIEYRLLSAGGDYFWVETYGNPVMDGNGQVTGVVLSSRDITKRKAEEKEKFETLELYRKATEGTVQAMGRIVELRDPYTAGHQLRVSRLASAIAEEMNLTEERINALRLAAEIHDIGKISIPAEILTKPGKIDATEFSMIKNHPRVGKEILAKVEFPWPIADIIVQHHEKIDGSGYPNGLSGDDILLEAKILCVADVVEAMASHRPYRPALGVDKALEEILRHKGILFDADVVDACVKLIQERKVSLE